MNEFASSIKNNTIKEKPKLRLIETLSFFPFILLSK